MKYEYKVVEIEMKADQSIAVSEYGAEGWKLVSVVPGNPYINTIRYYFEREIANIEKE